MTTPRGGKQFEPYYRWFIELERSLEAMDWFGDDWHTEVGYYGGDEPRGVSFRLYKSGWFNDTGGGIHFESWIGNADLKRGAVPAALHIETNSENTGIKRGQFNKAILEEGAPLMDQWRDYKVSPNSYQTLIRYLPLTAENFIGELKTEYTRLQRLAPIIDRIIRDADAR
jgi:hypothetical protein